MADHYDSTSGLTLTAWNGAEAALKAAAVIYWVLRASWIRDAGAIEPVSSRGTVATVSK